MTLPATMRFIDLPQPGAPEAMRLATGPLPTAGPGDLLVRVEAAGVNRPDISQRQGSYPPPPGASSILGLECSGTISSVGAAISLDRIGEKVTALLSGGGEVSPPDGRIWVQEMAFNVVDHRPVHEAEIAGKRPVHK